MQQEKFDKRLAEEEVWLRQGIKARRTRNEGRVRALMAMRAERAGAARAAGHVRLQVERADASGKLVFEAEARRQGVRRARRSSRDFSTRIMRGDRIGLIGPNGAGKTTLLRLLLGELAPDAGEVRHGANVQVAYYDQQREQLDPERTVFDTVGDGNDTVTVNGRTRHVHGYLRDFLFPPERARSPVKALSGGERNRLLLARLFTRPANVLVLDEPTNDLDLETLELLEAQLVEWPGTLLLVSHDRAFLDNVVTSTLVFEGDGACRSTSAATRTGCGSARTPPARLPAVAAPWQPPGEPPAARRRRREPRFAHRLPRRSRSCPSTSAASSRSSPPGSKPSKPSRHSSKPQSPIPASTKTPHKPSPTRWQDSHRYMTPRPRPWPAGTSSIPAPHDHSAPQRCCDRRPEWRRQIDQLRRHILRGALDVLEFVKADDIARGLSPFNIEGAAVAAGRIMLARLRDLARQRVSFAFETTLASRTFAPWLKQLKQDGYAFHLIYLWVPSAESPSRAWRSVSGKADIRSRPRPSGGAIMEAYETSSASTDRSPPRGPCLTFPTAVAC